MAKKIPVVHDDTLVWWDADEERFTAVGTPDWFAWLISATTFSFSSPVGGFTARKESRQRGGWYWKAYCRRAGKLRRAYLGKSESLTQERLDEVASELANPVSGDNTDRRNALTGNAVPPLGITTTADSLGAGLKFLESPKSRTSSDPLLRTKLSLPPLRADLVPRPRLSKRLVQVLRNKLTLISAPAGFGKTTLLGQWVTRSGCRVALVSLDAGDNDPVRFWTYVVASLRTVLPHLGDQVLSLLRSSQSTVETFLTVLINTMTGIPNDVALVLDDYEVIESPSIHCAIGFLLDHLPPQVHLVIASRADPPLPLARLRAKGQLTELKAVDLSFTLEEATVFLQDVMGLALHHEHVAALEERTEGWIVGLQLAALSLQECNDINGFVETFAGDHRHIEDYLVDEVLRRQPEAVQTFLLKTSILDRLCEPLCEAVTGQGRGQEMLERLEQANLFTVPLDKQRHWYRYQHLFADSLRAWLQRSKPDWIPELHHTASIWYRDNGLPSEAVPHALAAHQFDLAAGIIEQAAAAKLTRSGELTTFLAWIRELPDSVVTSRPRLCLYHAWALANSGQLDAAEIRLKHAELCLGQNGEDRSGIVLGGSADQPAGVERLREEMIAIRATIALTRGDDPLKIALPPHVLEHATEDDDAVRGAMVQIMGSAYWLRGDLGKASETLTEAGLISQASGNVPAAVISLSQLARLEAVQGRLYQASKTYEQALQLSAALGTQIDSIASLPHVGLGWLLYEWNDLQATICHVTEGIQLAKQGGLTTNVLVGYNVLTRVKRAQGDSNVALDTLQQAIQLAQTSRLTQVLGHLYAYRARIWLAQGNVQSAVQWAETSGLCVDDELSYRHEADHMTLARVILAQGNPCMAGRLLERLQKAAMEGGRTGSVIKILTLLAVTQTAQGEIDQAMKSLEQALELAEPEGYVRTFLDAGGQIALLLTRILEGREKHRSARPSAASSPYVRTLITAFGTEIGSAPFEAGAKEIVKSTLDILSERELDVIRLLAVGKATAEIADEFVVAPSTVKTHVKNIYSKLDVHSRFQAIARARELNLLP